MLLSVKKSVQSAAEGLRAAVIDRSETTAAVALVGSAEESLYTEIAVAELDSFAVATGQDNLCIAAVVELAESPWVEVQIHWAAAGFAVAERTTVARIEAARGGRQDHLQGMSWNLRTSRLTRSQW